MGNLDSVKSLNAKFKNLRRASKLWAKTLSYLKTQIAKLNELIFLWDFFEEFRELDIHEWNCRAILKEHLLILLRNQKIYWKQRGKIKGVKFGDENTKFFHTKASINHRHNHIAVLQNEDEVDISDHAGKAAILWDTYKKRMGTSHKTTMHFDLESLFGQRQDSAIFDNLELPFTEEEINEVVKQLPPDKSPGPDGFNGLFMKKCWHIIKHYFYKFINDFYNEAVSLAPVNTAYITLIPKNDNPEIPDDYRPISLVSMPIKILTKLLANRVQQIIISRISKNQYGFIKTRNIQDCLAWSFEYIHQCQASKQPIVFLKLDFAKAFGTIEHDAMLEIMRGWCEYELKEIDDAERRAAICGVPETEVRQGVQAIVLSEPLEISSIKAKMVYDKGPWPRFFFSKGGKGGIARKTYLESVGGKPPTNYWSYENVGHTDEAAKTLRAIFNGRAAFETPKPYRLVERILQIAADENSIILDSFAGSGTTAHAVLNMNKADGGNRRFILIEMQDYADSITAERVKRVIHGYGEGKSAVEGTGGDFCFYELGERLMLENGALNPDMDVQNIRNYIWYTETKKSLPDIELDDNKYFLAVDGDVAYYFCYEKDTVTTLDRTFLRAIRTKAERYIIYANQCAISDKELQKHNITFKKIPRDIVSL